MVPPAVTNLLTPGGPSAAWRQSPIQPIFTLLSFRFFIGALSRRPTPTFANTIPTGMGAPMPRMIVHAGAKVQVGMIDTVLQETRGCGVPRFKGFVACPLVLPLFGKGADVLDVYRVELGGCQRLV